MDYLNGYEKPNCNHCGLDRTPEGYDGCIGKLEGVKNACCGHGQTEMAYIQFDHKEYDKEPNKNWIGKQEAIDYILKNKIVP